MVAVVGDVVVVVVVVVGVAVVVVVERVCGTSRHPTRTRDLGTYGHATAHAPSGPTFPRHIAPSVP